MNELGIKTVHLQNKEMEKIIIIGCLLIVIGE